MQRYAEDIVVLKTYWKIEKGQKVYYTVYKKFGETLTARITKSTYDLYTKYLPKTFMSEKFNWWSMLKKLLKVHENSKAVKTTITFEKSICVIILEYRDLSIETHKVTFDFIEDVKEQDLEKYFMEYVGYGTKNNWSNRCKPWRMA